MLKSVKHWRAPSLREVRPKHVKVHHPIWAAAQLLLPPGNLENEHLWASRPKSHPPDTAATGVSVACVHAELLHGSCHILHPNSTGMHNRDENDNWNPDCNAQAENACKVLCVPRSPLLL